MFSNHSDSHRAKSAFAAFVDFVANHRFAVGLALAALLIAGAILPLTGQSDRDRGEGEHEHDSALLIRRRAEWFFHQRAYPLGHIPVAARVKAIQQMEQMRRTQGTFMDRFAASASERIASPQAITPSTTTWTSIGPQPTASGFFGNVSGRVNALAVDPCDATGNTVYLGGAQGGVWKTTNSGSSWSQLTDNQLSLASGSLALDPNPADCTGGHTGAVYYGTGEENFAFDSFYGAGVLVSHDGGATWSKDNTFVSVTSGTPSIITPQSPGAAGPFIGSLSVDPATKGSSQIVLAAIQGVSSTANSGIWRSSNGGANWTHVLPTSGSPAPCDFGTGVVYDPNDLSGQTAYAALGIPFPSGNNTGSCGKEESDNGVYKSTDGGATWTRLTSLDTAAASQSGNYGRITIAAGPSATPGDPTSTELIVTIADITTTSSDLLGCPTKNGVSPTCTTGVFQSNDGGKTFAGLTTPAFCNNQCFYDMAAAVNPANAKVIFLGGGPAANGSTANGNNSPPCGNIPAGGGISAVIESTDGGQTWADVSCDNATGTFIHVDTHAFAFAPGKFYIGNDGGVWSSSSVIGTFVGSQDWSDLNNSLSLTQFYPGNSIHPSNPEITFGGTQDNGMQIFQGAPQWADTNSCGDGAWTAIDPLTPSTVYTTCEAIGQAGTILKNQLDGTGIGNGINWIALDTPAMDADNTNFIPPMVLDHSQPQNVYFGTSRVWQSTNGGISWTAISNTLPSSSRFRCGNGICVITSLSVAASDSNTVYVGSDTGQIFSSTNATGSAPTFNQIDQSNMPNRVVTQVIASPLNAKVAFASFSGFSSCSGCDNLGHIFMTTNGGGSWTNITGNLPDTPVNDIVVDPTNNTLYVATDVGVFATSNASSGASWLQLATGLPQIECTSLKLSNTARVLRVGTHGRGIWDLQLPGLPASALTAISPTSTAAGSTAFQMTLSGVGLPTNPTVMFGTTSLAGSGSGTQVTVSVPATAISGSAVVPVSVSGAQNSLNFSIEAPIPGLSSISPTSANTSANVTLTVSGSNFNSTSQVVWTPISGTGANVGISTALSQNAGSLSCANGLCQFTVTVPVALLKASLTRMVPVAPATPVNKGPGAFWFLAALCAGILGILALAFLPRKRRLIFGATLTTVLVLVLIAGCSGSNSSSNNPPPPPPQNSVKVAVNVLNQAPGGGFNSPQQQQIFIVNSQ